MIEAVQPDLVTLPQRSPEQVRGGLGGIQQDEERGMHMLVGQHVEEALGDLDIGAIVEGERYSCPRLSTSRHRADRPTT